MQPKTERNMVQVCEGTKSKGLMLEEAIVQYKDIFMRAKNGFNSVVAVSCSHF
jgi:DNA topoisomerase-3